jgi:2-polyprenyl-3-methyl-5-hydroxy-6-metoxy-1,4-benzoquinol methylase
MTRTPPRHSDARVIEAWRENAAPWTQAVRAQAIESRRLVTDRIVVETALRLAPRSVLDLGCGEGWLSRALCLHGIEVHGVDAIADLIDAARRMRTGAADAPAPRYDCLSYEDIAAGALQARYDLAICNFSLLGDDSVAGLLGAMPGVLNPRGRLLIQTLHPPQACGDAPYLDGWRDGSWTGCDAAFGEPAPWYFRTIGGWVALLERSGLRLRELAEPVHPVSGRPVSLLLVADAG